MIHHTIEAFAERARRDAALQAQVVHALQQPEPARALCAVAESAGFQLTEADVAASLGGPMSDAAMESVVGGFASKEWFAETFRLDRPHQIEGD